MHSSFSLPPLLLSYHLELLGASSLVKKEKEIKEITT